MGREAENYRDILESILEFSGGKRLLNKTDVARYLGVGKTTVNTLGVGPYGITVEVLARKLANL